MHYICQNREASYVGNTVTYSKTYLVDTSLHNLKQRGKWRTRPTDIVRQVVTRTLCLPIYQPKTFTRLRQKTPNAISAILERAGFIKHVGSMYKTKTDTF